MQPIQDHLLSIYLPFCDGPLYEKMIDGTLWQLMQLTSMFMGLTGVAIAMEIWSGYRLNTRGKKNEN